jgi:hypothetical protein
VSVKTTAETITVADGSTQLAQLYSSQCSAPQIDVQIPRMILSPPMVERAYMLLMEPRASQC